MKVFIALITAFVFFSCAENKIEPALIPLDNFDTELAGEKIGLYNLTNSKGMVVQITNYGARVVALWVPDKNGDFKDVVMGFESIKEYFESSDLYHGPIVGRYGNRINKGQFTLNDSIYQLSINDGPNHLHGGAGGWESKVWNAEKISVDGNEALKLSYFSKDGEEGYPGNLKIDVTYIVTGNNELTIKYKAQTDAPTIINPTSHCYFNLSGTTKNTILSHILKIDGDKFTPTDEGLIPTGELSLVAQTPLDFRTERPIGDSIDEDYEPLKFGLGYDHNYVLNKNIGEYKEAAVIQSPESGIKMTVITDQPGLQFYSGNFMDGTITGKRGDLNHYRSGFALEAQNFPDAPNHADFPSAVLLPNEEYNQVTSYLFSVTN